MKLAELKNPEKYAGLYVVDFGDHSGVGFTAPEVAELLESESFKGVKVYKIYKAYPDGRMELKGVPAETFELEAGMFFYSADCDAAEKDFKALLDLAIIAAPPGRAKVHLGRCDQSCFVTALIFPAEYNDEFSQWLLDGDYKTEGAVEGGIGATQSYYQQAPEILKRYQLLPNSAYESRTGEELLKSIKLAVQR